MTADRKLHPITQLFQTVRERAHNVFMRVFTRTSRISLPRFGIQNTGDTRV